MFKDTIWAGDLAEMRSLSFKNHGIEYPLYVIDVSTKFTSFYKSFYQMDKKLKEFLIVLLD